ncbi:MAG: DUF1653 domain-containing protein [Pseudomonadota bacterium]
MEPLPRGRYRHYKGGEYDVYGVARHSESDERFVVYRPCYGERGLWIRPLNMFLESVEVDGTATPRFAFVSEGSVDLATDALEFGAGESVSDD